ncbi:hypothetical protein [Morganella psychrotolerans]|uniref:hypothetical protein n=1 Tax=Morganella psychrotolerans TaxID=368603 RepID=UPI0039B03E4E
MQQLYTLIILSEPLKGKEITLPNGCYTIHSYPGSDKKDVGHKTSISLNIKPADTSLTYIEIILLDNSYIVYHKENKDILITEEINYNIPFYHDEKALFAIKKIDDQWDVAILTIKHNNLINKEKYFNLRQKKRLLLLIAILIILIFFWLYDKNRSENNYKNDTKTTINQFIRHNGYIQNGNHLLFIMKSGDTISDNIHNKLKPYIIYTLTENSLKHRKNDIVKIKKNNKLIDIIYINKENSHVTNNIDIIPDIFRSRLKIKQYSFHDIINLIKKIIGNDIINYTIIRKNNEIIVSSEQKNNNSIAEHIRKINKVIFQNDTDTLILYQQTKKNIDTPGIYGEQSYRILPGDHIDFTLP